MGIIYTSELPEKTDYLELFKNTGWYPGNIPEANELLLTLKRSYYSVFAYDNNRLVGSGRIMSDGILHAMIYEMIVHSDYQGKGIGREILQILVEKCLENNIRDIQLFCAQGKEKFYKKYGFEARPDDAPGMQYKLK